MKRLFKWPVVLLVGCLCVVTLVAASTAQQVEQLSTNMYQPLRANEELPQRSVKLSKQEKSPFSIALLGVDERGEDKGRADTIIICTINPSEQSAKLLSIPRDTHVEIFERQMSDKINHSYAYGGTLLTVETIEQLLEIPIDYAVKVNMEGFTQIIDAIGGVEVENAFAFHSAGENFSQGAISLDGDRALSYVRMRYDDPQGDFGRQNRQKDVIKALMNEATKLQTVRHYSKIIDVMEQNVEMNLSFDTLLALRKDFMTSFQDLEQYYFTQGAGKTVDGIYYYFLDEAELHNIQLTLQSHLQLPTKTLPPHTE
ncbi:LCP family protein [Solibacillus sp. FSL H8-0523]|uniref:LCP family glycopolymer transferase n=1 Tax=Solibacillus sp. FSL H8-0523 TaxID=2954511 RepID=UPI0031010184